MYIARGCCTPSFRSSENPSHKVLLVVWVLVLMLDTAASAAQLADVVHIAPNPESPEKTMGHQPESRSNTLFSRVDLVLVPVTVSDSMDRPMLGLKKENFQIFDNKQLQPIEHFSSEDAPVSIVLVLDTSGSMAAGTNLEKAKTAIVELLNTSNPQDEVSLVTVADKPELRCGFTDSPATIQNELISAVAQGRTALLDGIYFAISQMKNAKYSRRALLIISDGGDNHSRYNEREVKEFIKESDLMIYAIGVYDEALPVGNYLSVYHGAFLAEEERLGPFLLSSVSELTGGRSYSLKDPDDMIRVAVEISLELRNQYLLGYHPQMLSHDGKWHKIKVKVLRPKGLRHAQVTAKKGYYAISR